VVFQAQKEREGLGESRVGERVINAVIMQR